MNTDTADQLIRKALELQQLQESEGALQLLQRGAEMHPRDGRLRFLLGSLLAAGQAWAEAEREMAEAARLEPALHIAHFQLGSMRMTSGDGPGALAAWAPLSELPESDPLHCFARGCAALVQDDFAEAEHWLQLGLERNTANLPLNGDMSLLLARLREARAGATPPATPGTSAAEAHLLVHGYQDVLAEPGPRH